MIPPPYSHSNSIKSLMSLSKTLDRKGEYSKEDDDIFLPSFFPSSSWLFSFSVKTCCWNISFKGLLLDRCSLWLFLSVSTRVCFYYLRSVSLLLCFVRQRSLITSIGMLSLFKSRVVDCLLKSLTKFDTRLQIGIKGNAALLIYALRTELAVPI